MTIQRLDHAGDPRLNVYSGLTNHQLRNRLDPERAILIAESQIAIRTAIEAGARPLSFLLDERMARAMADVIGDLPEDVPVFVLPPEEAARMTGYRVTRGALCAMRRPELPDAEALLDAARRVVVLEGLTDASNVGATFRNAAALGADAVLVAPDCADPFSRRAVRVSMGNVLRIPWAYAPRPWPDEAARLLHGRGVACLALALTPDAVPLDEVAPPSGKVALFLGAEGTGLKRTTIARCDQAVVIPMARGVDSLNVAAAGAIAMWQLFGRAATTE